MTQDFDDPAAPTVPHSREAEEAVVGAVLINPNIFPEVSQFLAPDDFYIYRLRIIWAAFLHLHVRRIAIDILTVEERLTANDELTEIGGPAFITSLINATPTSLNAVDYGRIVKEHAERRKGIAFGSELAREAYDLSESFDLRSKAIKVIQASGGKTRRVTPSDAASQAFDQINNHQFCEFGISSVDDRIGGLFVDELEIVAGYQGTGKSALKIHAMRHNADQKKRVLDASLEMSAAQIWMRMACGDLQIDLNQVRSGRVSDHTMATVTHKLEELAEHYKDKIVIYEAPMSPADILSATIIEQPDIVLVDHLRLLTGKSSKENPIEWYNSCIRFLRQEVAKGEHVNVMLLHQINRSSFKESRRPSIHDLAFAGEDDPDSIFLLYRKPTEPGSTSPIAQMEIIVDKSRFGWTGIEDIAFHLTKQIFTPLASAQTHL